MTQMKKTGAVYEESAEAGWSKERRYQRAGCDLSARFLHQDKWRKARIITLSGGGAFLGCKHRVQKNQVIYLEFEMESHSISAISRVVWNSDRKRKNSDRWIYPPGFAVEFESMEGKERALVNHFVIRSLRVLRALKYELKQPALDRDQIRSLFLSLRPGDSLNLNHIRKIVQQEFRHFRLRKIEVKL